MREKARQLLRDTELVPLIGSVVCCDFSAWQNISNIRRSEAEVKKRHAKAMIHLSSVCGTRSRTKRGWTVFPTRTPHERDVMGRNVCPCCK